MTDAQYLGPRLEARRLREATRRRVEAYVTQRASELHRASVERWAREDDTPYPNFLDAREEAVFEAETLLRALGPWAGVPASTIPFGVGGSGTPGRPRRPGPPPHWLLGDD